MARPRPRVPPVMTTFRGKSGLFHTRFVAARCAHEKTAPMRNPTIPHDHVGYGDSAHREEA